MGADFSSACYGMALLPVSSVWDVFEFSGIAAGAGFDDSGDHDIAYRRILPLAAGTAAKVGHVILGYYKWICEGSLKLPGAVRIMGRPGPGQILGYIVLWGIAVALLRCQRRGQTRKILKKYINLIFAVATLLTAVLFSFTILSPHPVRGFELLCFDVGQGDGFLLRSGTTNILIDSGSSDQKNWEAGLLSPALSLKGSPFRYSDRKSWGQ